MHYYRGVQILSWWFGHTATVERGWKEDGQDLRVPGEIDAIKAEIDRLLGPPRDGVLVDNTTAR